MQYRIIPIIITVLVVLLGYTVKKSRINSLTERINFTIDFHNTFIDLVNYFSEHRNFDTAAYDKYMHDVDAIHLELGRDGMVWMKDNLTGISSSSYQPLANLTEEMRNESVLPSNYITGIRLNNLYGTCDDILRRHLGNLDRMMADEKKQLHNPIVCFGEGVRTILRVPMMLLAWLGLISENSEISFSNSKYFKVLGNIFTFIGFISSIFTIVLGWNDFVLLIKNIIAKF